MNIFFARLSALALSGVFWTTQCLAVPANPRSMVLTEPDGTTVTLRLVGDESFHCFITEEGYPAERDETGIFRLIGNDGNLTAVRVSALQTGSPGIFEEINPGEAFANRRKAVLSLSPYPDYRRGKQAGSANLKSRLPESRWDNSDGHDIRKFPTEGVQKVLVILVNFADLEWSFSATPHDDMMAILNEPGFSGDGFTGSARDYFIKSSNGIFLPEFDVYGPVTLPEPCAFYGENLGGLTTDANPARMVLDACSLLDDEVDFSQYDRDGDGVIDNVYVFYAGYGENEGAESWRIWPHAWDVRHSQEEPLYLDGVLVGHYACSNEKIYPGDRMAGIGTMCHEFSHVLGLPDLYATKYTGALTPGRFSCMDQGPYNNDGRTPPLYSSYERYALEWQKPVDIVCGEKVRMLPLSAEGNAYRMTLDPERPWEYFLFENRQQEDFDAWLPGHGMLVWHINYDASLWNSNIVNNDPMDQHVDLVEADGAGGDQTASGDPFPGASGTYAFTAESTPAFVDSRGKMSPFGITMLAEDPDGTVVMTVGEGRTDGSRLVVESPLAAVEEIGRDYFVISASFADPGDEETHTADDVQLWFSVFKSGYDSESETFGSEVLPDYDFVALTPGVPVRIEGLASSSPYSVRVYGSNGLNVSDPSPLTVITSGGGVESSRPQLMISGRNALRWSAVENASHYLLSVATREYGDYVGGEPVTFTQRRVPAGWDFMGSFISSEGTFGESAPSLLMSEADDYLWTASCDRDIRSVRMWAKALLPSMSRLEFYAVQGESSLYPVGSLMIGTEGNVVMTDIFPEGVRELVILATVSAGQEIYLDDITLLFDDEVSDIMHPDYDDREISTTSVTLEGLREGVEYVAWVKAAGDASVGHSSNCVRFVAGPASGIDGVMSAGISFEIANGILLPSDPDMPYDVYTADGRVAANSHRGPFILPSRGVYIVRTAATTIKTVW